MTKISLLDYKSLFAERIKAYRKLRNLTQEQVGERAGLSYKHIGQIERQEVNPSLEAMAKIAKALEVHLCELLIAPGMEDKVLLESINNISTPELNNVRETLRILRKIFRVSA